jgi:succinyl-CoA synthetase alpha subunit
MSILLDRTTPVLVQGITGVGGRRHTETMVSYGTRVVAGVSPGHRGEEVCGVPVFETCADASRETGATFAVSFVGGAHVLDVVCEAAEAGLETIVCMEEIVPVADVARGKAFAEARGCLLIGPNCNGVIAPGDAKVGFFPDELGRAGSVGVASRSGTLSYGTMLALEREGLGESTVVGIGGAALRGLSFVDCLDLFAADEGTELVILVGEIGGDEEERAAERVAAGYAKPVIALVAGRTAPLGVAMGHTGAMATASTGGWENKRDRFEAAGVRVALDLDELGAIAAETVTGLRRRAGR